MTYMPERNNLNFSSISISLKAARDLYDLYPIKSKDDLRAYQFWGFDKRIIDMALHPLFAWASKRLSLFCGSEEGLESELKHFILIY